MSFHIDLKKTELPIKGTSITTSCQFIKDAPVFEFKGDIINKPDWSKYNQNDLLQIGKDKYMGLSGDYDDNINHSCNPNCYIHIVGNRAFLYSLYNIRPGTEITYDYSITSTATREDWSFNCHCGFSDCRKIISGYSYLDDATKTHYELIGIVPYYQK